MPLSMNSKVFITCAITGSGSSQDRSPHVPRSPKEIAELYGLDTKIMTKGYKKFKVAKNPKVALTYLPLYKPTGKSAWKANVLAFPCK